LASARFLIVTLTPAQDEGTNKHSDKSTLHIASRRKIAVSPLKHVGRDRKNSDRFACAVVEDGGAARSLGQHATTLRRPIRWGQLAISQGHRGLYSR